MQLLQLNNLGLPIGCNKLVSTIIMLPLVKLRATDMETNFENLTLNQTI